MKKIYIWGTGKSAEIVYKSIKKDRCLLMGFVDRDKERQKELWRNQFKVMAPEVLQTLDFDYIIISVRLYIESVLKECENIKIDKKKVITFWDEDFDYDFIDNNIKKIALLEEELEKYKLHLENAPYELGVKKSPIVKSSVELLELIIIKHKSLCRFGDGELEIMRGKERLWYQAVTVQLSSRLREVFTADNSNIIIAIPDNFGCLECYIDVAAHAIRKYLSGGTRNILMNILGTEREYYDAYVTRPYIIYKNKMRAELIFNLFKKVWKGRKLLIVEGKNTRTGVNNDLLIEAQEIRRIICPPQNAYDRYEEILNAVKKNVIGNELILISLGPAATVLAYDLSILGLQALDIGQLDNEYEWYLKGSLIRDEIEGKTVSELSWCHNPDDICNEDYCGQIIEVIV